MQQGDFNFYYPYPHKQIPPSQTPYPQSNSFPQPPASASAPPFSANYASSPSDYPTFYPPDPLPTAPSFSTPPPLQQPQPSASFPQYETHVSYPQPPPLPTPPQPYYPTYDQHKAVQAPPPNYTSPGPNSIPKSPYDSVYSAQLNQLSSSFPPVYDGLYDKNPKFDQPGNYLDDYSGRYGSSGRERSDIGSNFHGNSSDSVGGGYGMDGYGDGDGDGDGVYAYQGSKSEPCGASGTAPKS